MKTKKAKLQVVLLAVFFILVILGSIATLSLNAGGGVPLPDVDGRWASVCCGPQCGLEGDYCKGTGTYTCCK